MNISSFNNETGYGNFVARKIRLFVLFKVCKSFSQRRNKIKCKICHFVDKVLPDNSFHE